MDVDLKDGNKTGTETKNPNFTYDTPQFNFTIPDQFTITKELNYRISYKSLCHDTQQIHEGSKTFYLLSDAILCASVIYKLNPLVEQSLYLSNSIKIQPVKVDDYQVTLFSEIIDDSFSSERTKTYGHQIRRSRIKEEDRHWWDTRFMPREKKLYALRVKIFQLMEKYDNKYFKNLSSCQNTEHRSEPHDTRGLDSEHLYMQGVFIDLLKLMGYGDKLNYMAQNTTLIPTILHKFFPTVFITDLDLKKIALLFISKAPCAMFHLIQEKFFRLKIDEQTYVNLISNELKIHKVDENGSVQFVNIFYQLLLEGTKTTPMTEAQYIFIVNKMKEFENRPFVFPN